MFFTAYDGTSLAYRALGDGPTLVCLPGGPMSDPAYLGELGGLSAHRRLVMLNLRGTGESAVPADPSSYRCDRLVADVEALREHLGLDTVSLLAHSGGTNLAVLYAARFPDRVAALTLVTPSVAAVGVEITPETRLATARKRHDEPWFPEAFAALEAVVAGRATPSDFTAIAPFFYGRWDDAARTHRAAEDGWRNDDAAAVYGSEGAFDPAATRAALSRLTAPVRVIGGEVDLNSPPEAVAEVAGLFGVAAAVVPGAGHFPWLDDPARFTAAVLGSRLEGRVRRSALSFSAAPPTRTAQSKIFSAESANTARSSQA
ncbi:alpha/beta fold hydrolase [Phytomonospora endophytica]|uniref:Pimeloyl-ACP methyl ester carboxylesterase n=1 Tax=Phytomonospora endophytica TaxID=714109 RepID=A0A841FW31_9ACTN|nr:alpha/beta hydrolase [Phytomonospora endophytica]MBB6038963.1 pimeloyl-ACP methyl ester carboxylesterase [Phytomonospora endophytica]GIG67933.1 hydrolase [Phytomonospora endophytica]